MNDFTGDAERIEYDETLGRSIRTGSPETLGQPTGRLVIDAVKAGRRDEAAGLLTYLLEENDRVVKLFAVWLERIVEYCAATITEFAAQFDRLAGVLGDLPSAATFNRPTAPFEAIRSGSADDVAKAVAEIHAQHWRVHDAQADWVWGLLTMLHDETGEAAMGEALRTTIESWYVERYRSIGEMSARQLFELAIEGMRGHCAGSRHDGEVEVDEDDEKWVMSFDPCGTGGAMRRGDPTRGRVPRTESPFSFVDVQGKYDWTWNESGVCLYCAHCSYVNEILPIEQTGRPLRVTAYPKGPGDRCTWTIYKSAENVPDWAYRRVGKIPPASDANLSGRTYQSD